MVDNNLRFNNIIIKVKSIINNFLKEYTIFTFILRKNSIFVKYILEKYGTHLKISIF